MADDLQATYDDVIIDDEIKETIRLLVFQSQLPAEAASHFLLSQIGIKGALLYGPPGTGKTHLGRAVARESGASMLAVDCAAMASQWVGETEKHIRAAFSLAARLAPCVLFIDEVDALFRHRRPHDRGWERSAVTQFLAEMDGLGRRADAPFVMVATNRPMDLDDAFLRRLPQKIHLGLPDRPSRSRILRLFLKDDDLDPLVNIEGLARVTEGYSGSDLRSLCAEAALFWALEQSKSSSNNQRNQSNNHDTDGGEEEEKPAAAAAAADADVASQNLAQKLRLTRLHFMRALEKIRPTVSRVFLADLNKFTRRFVRVARGTHLILPTYLHNLKGEPADADYYDRTVEESSIV